LKISSLFYFFPSLFTSFLLLFFLYHIEIAADAAKKVLTFYHRSFLRLIFCKIKKSIKKHKKSIFCSVLMKQHLINL